MRNQQSGFTLIELIAVIVIIGILAATAVPKFIDMSGAAEGASLAAMASNLESASALNHAVDIANDAGLTGDTPETIATCADAANLLQSGLPAGFSFQNDTDAASADGTACIIEHDDSGETASFILIGTS